MGELTKLGSGQAGYPSTEREPELTEDARQALTQAEADVQAAQAAFTLWLPAENALKAAQEAAKTGDSAAVLRHAKAVGELTKLGAEQAGYPSTEMPGKATTQKKTKRKPKPKAKKKAAAKKTVTAPKVQAASKPQAGTAQSIQPTSPAPVYAPEVQATVTNPAPAAKQIRPRKLCWQGDRLVECP